MAETKLRLVSDGTPHGTRLTTEDGTLIKGVQAVEWKIEVGGFARATVEILALAAEVVGLVELEEASIPEDPTAVPVLDPALTCCDAGKAAAPGPCPWHSGDFDSVVDRTIDEDAL